MKYRLSKLDPNRDSDKQFIAQGMVYRVVQCTEAEKAALNEINALVLVSRAALRRIYSGTLDDAAFNADIKTLEENDAKIQELSKQAHIEFAYLNPFANGRGFVED